MSSKPLTWNEFRSANKGKYTLEELSKRYHAQKASEKSGSKTSGAPKGLTLNQFLRKVKKEHDDI